MSALGDFVSHWYGAFVLTQLVEVPVYVAALGVAAGGVRRRIAAGFAGTAFTHPLLWMLLPWSAGLAATCGDVATDAAFAACYGRLTHVAELVVWLTEAALLRFMLPVAWWRCLLAALCANAASYALGLAIHALA